MDPPVPSRKQLSICTCFNRCKVVPDPVSGYLEDLFDGRAISLLIDDSLKLDEKHLARLERMTRRVSVSLFLDH
jgi:hypothetical protein